MKKDSDLLVEKYKADGSFSFSWEATLLEEGENHRKLKAYFNAPAHLVDKVWFNPGDLFIETYYNNRWYNVFEVHEGHNGEIKAWYSNLSYPAKFSPGLITWQDLELDLIAYPNGEYAFLDEEDYAALSLDSETRRQVELTIAELVDQAKHKQPPKP